MVSLSMLAEMDNAWPESGERRSLANGRPVEVSRILARFRHRVDPRGSPFARRWHTMALMITALEIPSGQTTIAAEKAGSGPLVVFLHAGVADRRMWRTQVAALAAAAPPFLALAYDRRGFGDTLHADEPFSQVGDLVTVLDAVAPGEPAILVGCSQGGRIAIDAALAHPVRVRALVLVAPAISGAPEVTTLSPAIEAWIARMEAAEAEADVDAINALEAHAWLDGPLAAEGRVSGAPRELFLAMNEIALRSEKRGVEAEPPSAFKRLREISVPTLVLWGDLDFPHAVERCQQLVSQVPNVRGQLMPGTAHLPNLEQPERFNRLLHAFCAAQR
jgi:pimeloyl-ACP methyl ester carboxylesterase